MLLDPERLRAAAREWSEENHPDRIAAAQAIVATGAFSQLQVAFALNEQLDALARFDFPALQARERAGVRVETDDQQPLAGLAEAIALAAMGYRPHLAGPGFLLTRAFLAYAGCAPGVGAAPLQFSALDARAQEERLSVAYLDGKENPETCEAFAEDVLLYDGASARCVRIVFAAPAVAPDRYLEAFAQFRGRIQAPDQLRAQVRMMEAFARKADLPRISLDDDSLLVTRGEAEPQRPGHLRWTLVDAPEDAQQWARERQARLYARRGVRLDGLAGRLGQAHRPGVDRFTEAWQTIEEWAASGATDR